MNSAEERSRRRSRLPSPCLSHHVTGTPSESRAAASALLPSPSRPAASVRSRAAIQQRKVDDIHRNRLGLDAAVHVEHERKTWSEHSSLDHAGPPTFIDACQCDGIGKEQVRIVNRLLHTVAQRIGRSSDSQHVRSPVDESRVHRRLGTLRSGTALVALDEFDRAPPDGANRVRRMETSFGARGSGATPLRESPTLPGVRIASNTGSVRTKPSIVSVNGKLGIAMVPCGPTSRSRSSMKPGAPLA